MLVIPRHQRDSVVVTHRWSCRHNGFIRHGATHDAHIVHRAHYAQRAVLHATQCDRVLAGGNLPARILLVNRDLAVYEQFGCSRALHKPVIVPVAIGHFDVRHH